MTAVSAPAVGEDVWLPVDESASVSGVRRRATELGALTGLEEDRLDQLAIVVTELATNVVKHGGGGDLVLRRLPESEGGGLMVVAVDAGPGTRHLAAMVGDGRSSTGTLGLGLGAVHRFADHVSLWSAPTRGTVVVARVTADGSDAEPVVAGLRRTIRGETVCGDVLGHREVDGATLLVVADGLGHGPLAAEASERALDVLHTAVSSSPGELVERMHRAMAGTRGAAVAVARVDPVGRRLVHAGVGNISGRLLGGARSRALLSQPGIVGHKLPKVQESRVDLDDAQLVVLHSDGVSERWTEDDLPPVTRHGAMVWATALLRDAGTRRDDASVLAMRVSA